MLDSCQNTVNGINNNISTLDSRVTALELNSGGDISQGAAIIEDIAEIKTIGDAATITLNSIKTAVDANSTAVSAMRTDVTANKTAVANVQSTVNSTNSTVGTINNNVNTANSTLASLVNRVTALETALANKMPNGASKLITTSVAFNTNQSFTIPRSTVLIDSILVYYTSGSTRPAYISYESGTTAWTGATESVNYVKIRGVDSNNFTVETNGLTGTLYYSYWA